MAAIVQTLIGAQGDGAALTNSTSATSLLPSQAKLTLPANYLDFVGRTFKVRVAGRVSNIVTTPGTLTLDIRFGSTVVFNGGAVQFSTTAHTSVPWVWDVDLTVRAVGSSATLIGQGMIFSQAVSISGADLIGTHSMLLTPNTAPVVGNTFDSTAAQVIDMFGKFSIGDPGNSITVHQFKVQSDVLF